MPSAFTRGGLRCSGLNREGETARTKLKTYSYELHSTPHTHRRTITYMRYVCVRIRTQTRTVKTLGGGAVNTAHLHAMEVRGHAQLGIVGRRQDGSRGRHRGATHGTGDGGRQSTRMRARAYGASSSISPLCHARKRSTSSSRLPEALSPKEWHILRGRYVRTFANMHCALRARATAWGGARGGGSLAPLQLAVREVLFVIEQVGIEGQELRACMPSARVRERAISHPHAGAAPTGVSLSGDTPKPLLRREAGPGVPAPVAAAVAVAVALGDDMLFQRLESAWSIHPRARASPTQQKCDRCRRLGWWVTG